MHTLKQLAEIVAAFALLCVCLVAHAWHDLARDPSKLLSQDDWMVS